MRHCQRAHCVTTKLRLLLDLISDHGEFQVFNTTRHYWESLDVEIEQACHNHSKIAKDELFALLFKSSHGFEAAYESIIEEGSLKSSKKNYYLLIRN